MSAAARHLMLGLPIVIAITAGPVMAQATADSAWIAGDIARAERLYVEELSANPLSERALHRLALIRAWSERYEESLRMFDHLLEYSPDNLEASVDRARVIAWANDLDGAIAAFETLAETHPESREVRSGLALTLAWAGRYTESETRYEELIGEDPDDVEALAGHARVAAWSDRLVEAEDRWRRALADHPEDSQLSYGLGQTLRWQGRNAAALEVLLRARATGDNSEIRRELALVEASFAAGLTPDLSYESDSEGNRMATARVSHDGWLSRRVAYAIGGYFRHAELDTDALTPSSGEPTVSGDATGIGLRVRTQLEPGWWLSGGAGVSGTNVEGSSPVATFLAELTTPARRRLVGTIGVSRLPLDETVELMRSGVVADQLAVGVRGAAAARWRLFVNGSIADFRASERNRRLAGGLRVERRFDSRFAIGFAGRAFGFERDASDGYFDPRLYALAELEIRWTQPVGLWTVGVELAPGIQRVNRHGDAPGETSAAGRAVGRLGFDLGPGRSVGLIGVASSTGMRSFSTGESDYRFVRIGVTGRWSF